MEVIAIQNECSLVSMAMSITLTIICLFLSAIVMYVLMKFIYKMQHEQLNKIGKFCGFIFIIATYVTLFCCMMTASHDCYMLYHSSIHHVISVVYIISYIIQSFTLLVIFFNRIYNVFASTRHKLSECTTKIYIGLFILELICAVFMLSTLMFVTVTLIITVLFFVIFITLMISLVALFVYKLIMVYNHIEKESDSFLATAITKTTILISTSVIITVIHFISVTLHVNHYNNHAFKWIDNYVAACDVFTNFLCVIMSYKAFKIYYSQMCWCVEPKCRSCWMKVLHVSGHDTVSQMESVITVGAQQQTI
eukprot:431250_1